MGRLMMVLTLGCVAITAAATISHLNGNPTAINGVIGAGFMTVVFGVLWWLDRD